MKRRLMPSVAVAPPSDRAADANPVRQVKVSLVGISPMVWRRVLVPATFTGAWLTYEYDLNIPWRHEVRIEDGLEREARKTYPVCAGGHGACPPEDCGGPESFGGGHIR